ncbi:Uroporphyrinogen decarboxylase [Trebouxia sp. C0010 RCD-2024]
MHSRQLPCQRAVCGAQLQRCPSRKTTPRLQCTAATTDPLLLRVARGEEAERTPVWLMRQAGRYMKAFREYSDKYSFRERSETTDIALKLSLQPWEAFQPDGVIMFSDILTPLPALGIEFDVIKGRGPIIEIPIRSMEQVQALTPLEDPQKKLPFVQETLSGIRSEVGNQATVLGFVGTPWTLAAYCVEGRADKHCTKTKTMMAKNPAVLHALLSHLTSNIADYVCYQIEAGAQVVQLFDSWAHHLNPSQFATFSLPYVEEVIQRVRTRHPDTPIIFHANGGTGKHHLMKTSTANVIGLDWRCDMALARQTLEDRPVQGNVDPTVLLGPQDGIAQAVQDCMEAAGSQGHILNVGDGVTPNIPEENVAYFVRMATQQAHSRNMTESDMAVAVC